MPLRIMRAMDGQRVGRVVRALRRRRGWLQMDLAAQASCSQAEISLVERGHVRSLVLAERILAALGAQLVLDVTWRGGALDRLLDEDHATLVATVARRLAAAGWEVQVEVTYSHFGERGSFDILDFMPSVGIVLVIEVKTYLASIEATVRKLDEKTRLALVVARERFGWSADEIGRVLVLADSSSARRRVKRHQSLFDRVLPLRSGELRRWLSQPRGQAAGLWFLSPSTVRAGRHGRGGRERVRCLKSLPPSTPGAS